MNCPLCGKEMRVRKAKSNGREFLGCSGFPACKNSMPIPKEMRERINGPTVERVITIPQPPAYDPSEEQRAIITELLVNQSEFLETLAGAGCGKTSAMVLAAWAYYRKYGMTRRVRAMAFNRDIADELATRMPPNVISSTTHTYGLDCITALTGKRPRIDGDKIYGYLNKAYPTRDGRTLKSAADKAENATNRAIQSYLKSVIGLIKAYMISTEEELESVLSQYDFEMPERVDVGRMHRQAFEIAQESLNNTAIVDFDDMLAIPAQAIKIMYEKRIPFTFPSYDLVIGDEAQDWSAAQHWLMISAAGRLGAKSGQIMVVGDPLQAIYGFRGADYDSMENFKALVNERTPNVVSLPLMETYRCAQAIVRFVNKIAPNLRAHPSNPEGSVEMLDALPLSDIIQNTGAWMILGRTNRPLIETASMLIKSRVPCFIRGRDFAKSMITMIVTSGCKSISDLMAWSQAKIDRETDKEKPDLNLLDKLDCIQFLAGECDTVAGVEELIRSLFSSDGTGVMLSSIHKAKGLERDCVAMIPVHAPHPMAKTEMALRQEFHLIYVGATRARHRLVIVRDPKRPFALSID